MNKLSAKLDKYNFPLGLYGLCVFWLLIFVFNVGPEWHRFSGFREVIDVRGTTTLLQFTVAIIALNTLVPKFLDKGRIAYFCAALFFVLFFASQLNVLISYFYLEPTYPDTYGAPYKGLDHYTLVERLGYSKIIRFIFFSKYPVLVFPAAILIAVSYYKRQQSLLEASQLKKGAELDALKQQLNPHFMFNTLNNIYSLAVTGSDRTAEAIAKLSGVLDYVLYRCNQTYVSLDDEVKMIEDYISLEKIRYGDRVKVTFDNNVDQPESVAPLLYLTLIENAFKHGSSQSLKQAKIEIALESRGEHIVFSISNTKPEQAKEHIHTKKPKIGLQNLKRQLDLIYPDAHDLDINESTEHFSVALSLSKVNEGLAHA